MVEFPVYETKLFITHPVLSAIASIVCIDEIYVNSLWAVYGYDKSYWVKT